ncbi:unnamed protein product [Ixodes pacificus]
MFRAQRVQVLTKKTHSKQRLSINISLAHKHLSFTNHRAPSNGPPSPGWLANRHPCVRAPADLSDLPSHPKCVYCC